jgi:uncharacterized membrane protein
MQTGLEIFCTSTMSLMAGIYLIFSITIMPSLQTMENGAYTMARINEVILNPIFKFVFFSSAINSGYFALIANDVDMVYRIACLIFFVGTFVVTVSRNVPFNNALKYATQIQDNVGEVWNGYLINWVRWNHVRTASAVSTVLLASLAKAG